jgi:hypothetical protein
MSDRPVLLDLRTDPRWDAFVEGHPFGQIYHLSAWTKVLEESFRHIRGYGLALMDATGTRIEAGLPFFSVSSWLTGDRLVSAPYATLHDPLVSDAAQAARLIQGLIRIKEERGFEFIEVRTLRSTALVRNADMGESRFYKHHVLDLDAPAEVLRGRFHRTCVRQRIARAEKSGLTLKTGRTKGDLDEFYGLLVSTRKRKALPTPPYRFFRALWEAFCPADRLSLIFAQKNGHTLAAAMILTYKDRVSVEYAASDDAFNHLSPVHFLFWEAIRSAREAGLRTFDFGRTSPRNASLMEFKERWGTRTVDLVHFYYPSRYAREPETREDSWKYGLIKACLAFDGLAPVHRALGAFCYRHMG